MQRDLVVKIETEIKQIELDMTAQKKIIKHSLGNSLAMQAAESELKALHTRQTVLKDNLSKLR